MANPLRWFRRHTKILMVFLGIGTMAIFGLGPVFDTLSRPGNYDTVNDPQIAQWRGGKLTEQSLNNLQLAHFQTQRFLRALQQMAAKKVGDSYRPLVRGIAPITDPDRNNAERVDDELIIRVLLAEKARKEGFVVSDGMVDEYLALMAGEAGFSRNDLIAINNEANQRTCSLEQVKNHLKLELMAQQMNELTLTGLPMVPNPTEAVQLHAKVTDRIECEVIPVAVSSYVSQVTETPSNSELRKLYEEGRYEYPDPTGENPGFKIGRKVKVQYMVGDYETFLLNEINKLTDAEVEAEYDRLVAAEDDLVMEIVPDDETPAGDAANPEAESETDAEEDGKQSFNIHGQKSQFVAAMPQEEEPTEPAGEPATEEPSTIEPAPESESEPANEPETESEAAETPAEGDEAERSTETQEDAEPATESATESTESTESADDMVLPPAVDPAASTEETTEEQPADEAASEEDDPLGPLLKDEPKIKRRPKPLTEVAEAIKRRLKQEDAMAARQENLQLAADHVTNYRLDFMGWETSIDARPEDKPAPLNYQAVAKEYNLVANETPLVDDEGLSNEGFGKVITVRNFVGPNGQPRPQAVQVSNLIFNEFNSLDLYEGQTVEDFRDQSVYLYWLSEKTEPRIPSFEEAREQVVEFWKTRRALELATAEAEKLASEANAQRDKKLSDLYPERTVQTGEFTWFSNVGSTTISNPIGVSNPGDQFMQTAFGLNKLEAGISPNRSKDTVYVVQPQSDRTPIEEVGTDYLANQFFKFKQIPNQVRNASLWYGREMSLDWNEEFVEEMGLEYTGR